MCHPDSSHRDARPSAPLPSTLAACRKLLRQHRGSSVELEPVQHVTRRMLSGRRVCVLGQTLRAPGSRWALRAFSLSMSRVRVPQSSARARAAFRAGGQCLEEEVVLLRGAGGASADGAAGGVGSEGCLPSFSFHGAFSCQRDLLPPRK